MTDVLWPPDIVPVSQEWRIMGNVGTFQSPLNGATRTVGRPGARWACRLTVPPVNGVTRARMMAVLGALRDRSARIWMPDFSVTKRGSFATTEFLSNSDFANGTTGWGATACSLSVTDRMLRLTSTKSAGASACYIVQSPSLTAYTPYAIRSFVAGVSRASVPLAISDNTAFTVNSAGVGMTTASTVPLSTGALSVLPVDWDYLTGSALQAGDWIDTAFTSVSRCALVDNAPNSLLYSDDAFGWAVAAATVGNNGTSSPDGSPTAQYLAETATTSQHYMYQSVTVSSAAADCAFSIDVHSVNRGWCFVQLSETLGGSASLVYVNLSTGALGTTSTGANWSNLRAFVVDRGSGWYRITIVARKTNAATAVLCVLGAATASGTSSYLGVAAPVALLWWRASFAKSSLPVSGVRTTSSATTGTVQTGTRLNVKGLPVSTSGLLRAGDPFSVNGQRNVAVTNLDSDAAGCGVLIGAIPFRGVADNEPVIINTPMSKMMLNTDELGWDTGPGQFSQFSIDLIEDVT